MRNWISRGFLTLALITFAGVTIWLNWAVRSEQQFSYLARSFLHGSLGFIEAPSGVWADTTPKGDAHYWPLGPLPAVVLMPFQFIADFWSATFYQGYVQLPLVGVLFVLVFSVARRLQFDIEDATYLGFGFLFSTACLGVAMWPWSWYFSHVIVCVLIFAAILEMTAKRRPLVVGTLFALCLATRFTAALGIIWFVMEVLRAKTSIQTRLRTIVIALVPCAVMCGLLLLYNYFRFGSPFEQGYAGQLVTASAEKGRAIGLFSWQHVPANLYTLLIAGPTPLARPESFVLTFPFVAANPWGMNLFVTGWCFLLLPLANYRDTTSRLLLITAIIVAIPVVFYYAVGFRQFGYRYSLDFLPLLYYLIARDYRQKRATLSRVFKAMLIFSGLWNLYLFSGHFIWHVT
jgi:hypothetical protein